MKSFEKRLQFLWGDAKPSQIAKDLNWSISGVIRIMEKGTMPKAETLIAIQKLKGCNWEWLMTGVGAPYPNSKDELLGLEQSRSVCDTLGNNIDVEDFVFIPRYDLQAAAGHGYFVNDEETPYAVAFRRFWIENYLHANPSDLSCIAVKGDSMEGVLNERDLILVNHAKNKPGDGLFVIRHGDNLIAKRTQLLPTNTLLISSANEAYEPFEIDLTKEYENISIIGKIEWFGRQV